MKPVEALVELIDTTKIHIVLKEPAYGIACGQSAVCYRPTKSGQAVIGGGIITCVD